MVRCQKNYLISTLSQDNSKINASARSCISFSLAIHSVNSVSPPLWLRQFRIFFPNRSKLDTPLRLFSSWTLYTRISFKFHFHRYYFLSFFFHHSRIQAPYTTRCTIKNLSFLVQQLQLYFIYHFLFFILPHGGLLSFWQIIHKHNVCVCEDIGPP